MEIPVRARLTEVVQSSEIARIVLGYLLDGSPESVYLEFARTNASLSEEYRLLQSGYRPTNSLNLIHIIQEFFEMKLLIGRFQQEIGVHDGGSSLTQSLKRILGIQSAKKGPVKRRFSSINREAFFVLKRSPDVSDCESEVKRGRYSQSPSPSYVLNEENELIVEGNRVQEEKPRPDTSCSSVQEVKVPPDSSQGDKTESPQVPLKQRLRKQTKKPEMYTEVPVEKKTAKKNKVSIISDEKVIAEQPRVSLPTNSFFLPTAGLPNFLFWHTIPPVTEPMGQIINMAEGGGQVVDVPVVPEAPTVPPALVEEVTSCPAAVEGSQSTPKNTEKPPFQFKSQSTPRRLASHVRCLFNTPSGKLQHTEVGSPLIKEVSDASKTPHVRKNAKQCARILSNTAEEPLKEAEDEKMREWKELRACSNSNKWDQHLRAMEREKADLVKVKRTPKVRRKIKGKGSLDLKAQMLEDALKSAKKPEPEKTLEKADILESLLTQEIAQEVDLAAEQVVEPLLPIGAKSVEKILSMSMLLETPFKDEFPGQFPSTPRFLIPNTTPAIRPAVNLPETAIKIPELTTPSFAITPGQKITPERESPQIGPCNRPTDYSSSSSYYKPDESEDTDQKIDSLISASRKRAEEGVFVTKTPMKLDNPTLLERVKSFTEEPKDLHYNFMFSTEAPEAPEPAEDTSSSSSSDSSTDTSSTSSDEYNEDKDKNWVSPEVETVSQMINKSGEIRFPLRSWISPKKLLQEEVKPEDPEPEDPKPPMKKLMSELQEKRLRVLEKMKKDQKPPVRKRQAVKRVSTTKPTQSPSKRKTPTPSKCVRTTPMRKTRLSLRKAPFKMTSPKKLPEKSLKGYTIPKKVQNIAKKASYYHEVFGSSSDEEKTPVAQPPTSKTDEEKSKQSLLAMLEDSPAKTKSPEPTKPPPAQSEPREEGEIEDSDDEYYALQPATTHKDLTICHDPQAKAPSFRLEEFNADAMVMKVVLEEKTHQLSLCDAVNIYEVLPVKRPKTSEKKPLKKGARNTKEVENAVESRKPTIKPKFSLKYKDSGMNSKNLAPTLKKPCPPAGGSALPKFAQNQIDVVLQHIHGSERK